jgi:hypothetical protein
MLALDRQIHHHMMRTTMHAEGKNVTQHQVLEGRWEEILSQKSAELAGRYVRVYVDPDEEEPAETLEAAMERLNSRTPEQIDAARKRILDATPEPHPLPKGKTLADVIMGQWPGDETDAEINEALRKLS